MSEHKKLALSALERMRGDDLYRARHAFKGKTPEQMQQQCGQSGRTCQQVLDEYEAHDAKVSAAIKWLESV